MGSKGGDPEGTTAESRATPSNSPAVAGAIDLAAAQAKFGTLLTGARASIAMHHPELEHRVNLHDVCVAFPYIALAPGLWDAFPGLAPSTDTAAASDATALPAATPVAPEPQVAESASPSEDQSS